MTRRCSAAVVAALLCAAPTAVSAAAGSRKLHPLQYWDQSLLELWGDCLEYPAVDYCFVVAQSAYSSEQADKIVSYFGKILDTVTPTGDDALSGGGRAAVVFTGDGAPRLHTFGDKETTNSVGDIMTAIRENLVSGTALSKFGGYLAGIDECDRLIRDGNDGLNNATNRLLLEFDPNFAYPNSPYSWFTGGPADGHNEGTDSDHGEQAFKAGKGTAALAPAPSGFTFLPTTTGALYDASGAVHMRRRAAAAAAAAHGASSGVAGGSRGNLRGRRLEVDVTAPSLLDDYTSTLSGAANAVVWFIFSGLKEDKLHPQGCGGEAGTGTQKVTAPKHDGAP